MPCAPHSHKDFHAEDLKWKLATEKHSVPSGHAAQNGTTSSELKSVVHTVLTRQFQFHPLALQKIKSMAPFNFIVLWTWSILGAAVFLYTFGTMRSSQAARNILFSTSYSLGATVFASNLCAGVLFAGDEPESFMICDVVGVAAGAAAEGLSVHFTFGDEE